MKWKKTEWLLAVLVIILSIIGIIAIGSATHIYNNAGYSNEFASQKIWFLIGIVFMILFSFIDYEMICKFYIPIYVFDLILLLAVLIIGKNSPSSVTRWISFGPIGIQPSEFAKIFTIIFLSSLVNIKRESINKLYVLILILLSSFIPVALIMKQPSLSASIVILAITFAILFISGLDYKYIYRTIIAILPIAVFLFWDLLRENHLIINKFLKDYQIERITTMIKSDPYSQNFYQTKQSMFAIGSGQIFGKGLFNGTINRLNYLPESHNDFIFSVIGEEFGFVGCMAVLCLLFWVIAICINVAKNSNSFLGELIACGIASMFLFQTFVNVGVATGILPNTGMPLPFISYGGSSMFVNMIAIGIVINVSINSNKKLFS
jgi:rod shape-determining protein RodA